MNTNSPRCASFIALILVLVLIGFTRLLTATPTRILRPDAIGQERAVYTTNPRLSPWGE